MKTALFILVIVLVLAIGFMLISTSVGRRPSWPVNTTFTFLGFTNTAPMAPATNAWFGINHPPSGSATWEVIEISHKQGAGWKNWDPLPNNTFAWHNPYPTNFTFAGVVPVETTNGPSRMVMRFTRSPDGKVEQFFAGLRLLWMRMLHPNSRGQWRWPGATAFVTNEFNVGGKADSTR